GVIGVRPARRAEVPEVERSGDRQQQKQRGPDPRGVRVRPAPQPLETRPAPFGGHDRRVERQGVVHTRWAVDAHATCSSVAALNRTLSRSANCANQSAPNTERFARGSTIARAEVDQDSTVDAATETATVDAPRPARDSIQ